MKLSISPAINREACPESQVAPMVSEWQMRLAYDVYARLRALPLQDRNWGFKMDFVLKEAEGDETTEQVFLEITMNLQPLKWGAQILQVHDGYNCSMTADAIAAKFKEKLLRDLRMHSDQQQAELEQLAGLLSLF
jgi:hypothetical protein